VPNHPDDLDLKTELSNLVGSYTRAERYTLSTDSAINEKEGKKNCAHIMQKKRGANKVNKKTFTFEHRKEKIANTK